MIQTAQTRRKSTDYVADASDLGGAMAKTPPSSGGPSATASLVPLEQGLYALTIGEAACSGSQSSGLPLPLVHVSAPPEGGDRCVEIFGASGCRGTWVGHEGGTVIVKSPPGGGHVLVTAFGLPGQIVPVPDIDVRRLELPQPSRPALGLADTTHRGEEIRTEIVLHVERLGDRRYPGQGWVGNRGKRLRIEAFSIRPVELLTARDIEFRALGPNRRQTPWVTDAKLCGTRGQGLPLTGFAIRLAPPADERFEIVYEGAFFESGVMGPIRNGELCVSPIADDPLEAINVRLIPRSARYAGPQSGHLAGADV